MNTCSRCGGEIEFKYIKNRCVPIHIAGGCSSWNSAFPVKDFSGYSSSKEGCCFETKCPECNDPVFFIRHNGGCVWVDPPLGYPWYVHPCMDWKAEGKREVRATLVERTYYKSKNLQGVVAGVVVETSVSPYKAFSVVTLETGKNERYSLLVAHNAGFLIDKLVLFNPEKQTLAWIFGKGDSFKVLFNFSNFPENKEANLKCPLCEGKFSAMDLIDHIRKSHWYKFSLKST